MLKIKFFHLPKPRKFNYIPRYFDPETEEREKRKAELAKIKGSHVAGDSIHGAFTERLRAKRKAKQSSNTRLLIIIVLLGILAWWLMN